MQNDLISRQSLMAHFATSQALVNDRDVLYCNGVLDVIEREPAVDAVPVVHGWWITSSDIPDRLICSVCGRRYDMYHFDQKDMPFCLCGAKMDGGAEIE